MGTMLMSVIKLSLLCLFVQSANGVNNRPIIGILAQDVTSQYGRTYISATYVKFLEESGARVVPIRGGQTLDYYQTMVNYTNGILIPGGSVNFASKSEIGRSSRIVYDLALELNRKGDYYPIWGTCMGFQILCYLTQGKNLLKETDSSNITWPLDFTPEAQTSRMFKSAPLDVLKILSSQNVTQNEHNYSILIPDFEGTQLAKFYSKLSTNTDRKGTKFVSTIEAKEYPFYGTQWHPEKNSFNWNPKYVINHSGDAVKVGQYMSNFFVSEARKSQHKFPSIEAEENNMIQNYKRVFFKDGTFFELYFIDPN